MKRCDKVFSTGVIIVSAIIGCSLLVGSASALTYQDEVDLEFVLNPTISISVSDDLTVANLVPGNYGDSNIITVSSSSNAVAGYAVYSTVGSSTYASNELKKDGTDNINKFTSISTNKATLADFSDSNWGYAWCSGTCNTESTWVSGDVGSTTSGYNGLPLYTATGVKVVNSSTPGSSTVSFKIGARAASSQVAGTYNNVINFVAVANPNPEPLKTFDQAFAAAGKTKYNGYYKMQDADSIACSEIIPAEDGEIGQVIDTRDDQVYKIGKLADGKCWMLENLNLAGGTALDTDKTDVTSAYISSFTTSNNLTKNGNTIVLPGSSTSGFNTNNYSYVYNSGNKTDCGASGQDTPCYSYYSWDAATLGSGRTIATDNTDADQSICPKGWKLPTARTTSASNWQSADFYAMAHQYGLDSTTSTQESDSGFYTQAGPGTTPSFLLAGRYYYGSFSSGGSYGYYWSSTSSSNMNYARNLFFSSSFVYSPDGSSRLSGFSVRCLLRG